MPERLNRVPSLEGSSSDRRSSLDATEESSPSSRRASFDDYFKTLFSSPASTGLAMPSPVDDSDLPPAYDVPQTKPRHRPPVQPREDEGHEALPPYSNSISLQAVLMRKMELVKCIHRPQERDWSREYVSLQGTALSFYKCKSSGLGGVLAKLDKNPDLPSGIKKGDLIKTYNLQHAEAGIAADYTKRRYVIRVRAEADQFLLCCSEIGSFVDWLQSLFAAIDLSLPLDERDLPRDQSVPRSRRNSMPRQRQNQGGYGQIRGGVNRNPNTGADRGIVRQRSQRAPLILEEDSEGEEDEEEEEISDVEPDDEEDDREDLLRPGKASPIISRAASTASTSVSRDWAREHTPTRAQPSASTSGASSSRPRRPAGRDISRLQMPNSYYERTQHRTMQHNPRHPNISPGSGKWHPIVRRSSTKFDMIYARRCLDILLENSPRKSNLLVLQGKQWIVDWNTGKLTRWGPPEYAEVVGESTKPAPGSGQRQMGTRPGNPAKKTAEASMDNSSVTIRTKGAVTKSRTTEIPVPHRTMEHRPKLRAAW